MLLRLWRRTDERTLGAVCGVGLAAVGLCLGVWQRLLEPAPLPAHPSPRERMERALVQADLDTERARIERARVLADLDIARRRAQEQADRDMAYLRSELRRCKARAELSFSTLAGPVGACLLLMGVVASRADERELRAFVGGLGLQTRVEYELSSPGD